MSSTEPTGDGNDTHWQIGGSVGRWDKGAHNAEADVEMVQDMLRHAWMILKDPRLDPGTIDGSIGRDAANSATVKAIEAFQSRFMSNPDGLISVGGRTWRALVGVLQSGSAAEQPEPESHAQTAGAAQCFFPFDNLPTPDWTAPPRCFGARRSGGARAHAGCDIYFPVGTTIRAIADGTVIEEPHLFYAGTDSVVIDHGDFVARYGEVAHGSALVHKGDRVKACQPIAKVGKLTGLSVSMLHLELYDKSAQGPLTVDASTGARTPDGRPFMRRKDLIDPTPKLNEWRNNLAGGGAGGGS
jgi:murein DD-endopeptidase MepM/ murein hydrolase activator NlpD